MGFLASDLTPSNPTAISPACKAVRAVVFKVARTDTVASLKQVLPADSSILEIVIYGPASDAGTTAVLSVGTTSTATELVSAQDVKGAGVFIRPSSAAVVSATNYMKQQAVPLGADIQLFAKYAETGGASTVGSWTVLVYFVR